MMSTIGEFRWSLLVSREFLFLVLGVFLGALATWFVATEVADWPPYQARSTLLIDETPDADQVGVSAEGIRIAQETIAALIVREPMASEVAESVGRGFDGESLVERLRVDRPEGAPIVEIVATHSDPETAALIANATARSAADLDNPLTGVSVLSEASVPTRPVFSSYLLIAVGGVLGGLVSAGAATLTRRLPRRISAASDIEDPNDYTLIGEVDLSLPEDELTAKNGFVLAKVMTAVDAAHPNLLFTSPREISQQRQYLELQSRFLQHKLDDALGAGATVRLVAMDKSGRESPRKGKHDFVAGADLVPLFTEVVEERERKSTPVVSEPTQDLGFLVRDKPATAGSNGSGSNGSGSNKQTGKEDQDVSETVPSQIEAIASDEAADPESDEPSLEPSPTQPVMVEQGLGHEEEHDDEDKSAVLMADWLSTVHLGEDGPSRGLADAPGRIVSLVEGPPVLEEPNVVIQLSKHARVILLLERGSTRIHDAAEARQVLEDAGVELAGTVLVR